MLFFYENLEFVSGIVNRSEQEWLNELGRIDLYQWIYFIAQHAKRDVRQMGENLEEWQQKNSR